MDDDKKSKAEKLRKIAIDFFHEKNYGAAIENFTETINLYPYVASYYENRSYCYLKLKLYDYAKKDAIKAIELHPNSQNCYLVLAKCCIMNGKIKEATEWLNNTKRTVSSQKYDKLKNMINKSHEFMDLLNNGQYFQGCDKIEELLMIESCIYFELLKAFCLIYMNKLEEALEIIEKFVFEDSCRFDVCTAFYALGLLQYYKGDFSNVSIYLQQAVTLTDDQDLINTISKLWKKSSGIETLMLKGQIAIDEKKYLTALNSYNQALSIDPNNKSVKSILHFQRASIFMKMQNYTAAIKDLSIVLGSETSNSLQALLLRSECFEKLKSIEDCQKNILSDLQHERKMEANLNHVRLKRMDIDENEERKETKTCDAAVQCDYHATSYDISFIPKDSTSWKFSKTMNGQKTFYPFDNSTGINVEQIVNKQNEIVYKIKLLKD